MAPILYRDPFKNDAEEFSHVVSRSAKRHGGYSMLGSGTFQDFVQDVTYDDGRVVTDVVESIPLPEWSVLFGGIDPKRRPK